MPAGQLHTDAHQPSNQEKIVTNCWSPLDGLPPDFDDPKRGVIAP